MHRAPTHIKTLFPGTPSDTVIKAHVISNVEATTICSCLHNDAVSYIYSATITIADALRGIRQNFFTWATVKLYYATFYSCRALLALDDICIFYMGKKPFSIEVKAGNSPQTKGRNTTHKIVLNEFRSQGIAPRLISQDIEYVDPLTWLMTKREEANYNVAKFQEPNIPKHFQKIIDSGIRQTVTSYLQDSSDLYLFDADHAIVAYPLKTLQYAYNKMKTFNNLKLTNPEISHLCNLFKDNRGPIPEVHKMIRD